MCPELPAPANGALACSTVRGNQICTMACNERFQTPLKPPSEFVCNDEQEWIQGIPPNCTSNYHAFTIVLAIRFWLKVDYCFPITSYNGVE